MKRKFFAFIALITATLSLSSCLSSDETTVEYTHDTAITAFSLGSLDRYTKTKAGKDTLLKANVTGSDYKFYIDQAQRLIYNVDSLPCGVRDTAILATISSKNSSPILLMDINKPDSVAAYYSSSDSINFSKPRFIRVYSSDYSAYAEYKVTVNVHKELPYEFKWHELAQNNSQLAAFSDLKAVACGDYIYVFGKTADGTEVLKSAINDGSAWSSITMNESLSSDAYQSAVALDGKLYISDAGKVYASADAEIWTEVSENADVKLIGASSKYLYAYTATGISVSKDKGASWKAERLDTDADYLPTQNISMNVAGVLPRTILIRPSAFVFGQTAFISLASFAFAKQRDSAIRTTTWKTLRLSLKQQRIAESKLLQPTAKMHLRSEEHTSELQSRSDRVCRLLLEKHLR